MCLTKWVAYFVVLCVCVCVLMQAGQARVWFHDVILVEERRLVYLFEVVSCASASRSAWCNCLLPSLLAWCCCPLSLLGAKHLCVCGFGQYINLKEKYGCGGFFWEGGEGDVDWGGFSSGFLWISLPHLDVQPRIIKSSAGVVVGMNCLDRSEEGRDLFFEYWSTIRLGYSASRSSLCHWKKSAEPCSFLLWCR